MTDTNPFQPPAAPVADVVDASQQQLAGRWARLGASFIDGLILTPVTFPVGYALGIYNFSAKPQHPLIDSILMSVLMFIMFAAIQSYFLAKTGQTIGKKALGIRIVNLDDKIPSLRRLVGIRYAIMYLVTAIPFIGAVIGIVDILMIFRSDKRCLHDLVAGTRVVRNSPAPA